MQDIQCMASSRRVSLPVIYGVPPRYRRNGSPLSPGYRSELQPRSPCLLTPNRSPTDSPFPGRRSLPQTPTGRMRRSLPSTPRTSSPRPILPAPVVDDHFLGSSSGTSSHNSSCELSPRPLSTRRREFLARRTQITMRDSGFMESAQAHDEVYDDVPTQLRSFDMTKGGLVDKGFQARPPATPNLLTRRAESRRATCPEIWLFPEATKPVKRVALRVYGSMCVGKKTLCQQIYHHAATARPEAVNKLSNAGESIEQPRCINFLLNGDEIQLEILLESALESSPFSPHVTMFVVMFSVTSRESFTTAANLLYRIFQHRQNTKVPVLLIGNKIDLKRKKVVNAIEGRMLAKIYKCAFLEISALMAMNADLVWKEILTKIKGVDLESRSFLERIVERGRSIARSCEEIVHKMRHGDGLQDVHEASESRKPSTDDRQSPQATVEDDENLEEEEDAGEDSE